MSLSRFSFVYGRTYEIGKVKTIQSKRPVTLRYSQLDLCHKKYPMLLIYQLLLSLCENTGYFIQNFAFIIQRTFAGNRISNNSVFHFVLLPHFIFNDKSILDGKTISSMIFYVKEIMDFILIIAIILILVCAKLIKSELFTEQRVGERSGKPGNKREQRRIFSQTDELWRFSQHKLIDEFFSKSFRWGCIFL